jgi:hypothetical protein
MTLRAFIIEVSLYFATFAAVMAVLMVWGGEV